LLFCGVHPFSHNPSISDTFRSLSVIAKSCNRLKMSTIATFSSFIATKDKRGRLKDGVNALYGPYPDNAAHRGSGLVSA